MALMAAIAAAAVGGLASGVASGAMGGKGGGGGGGGTMMPQAGSISQGIGGSILKNAAGPIGSLAAQLASRGIRSAMGPGSGSEKTVNPSQVPNFGVGPDASLGNMPMSPQQQAPPPTYTPPTVNPYLMAQFMPNSFMPPTQFDPTTAGGGGYFA